MLYNKRRLASRKGFTFLELLIVVAILGMLLIGGFGAYRTSRKNAADARRKTDLETFRQALELYKSNNGTYPNSTGSTETAALKDALTGITYGGPYINDTAYPQDPLSNRHYYYSSTSPNNTYAICAKLENKQSGDPDCPIASVSCGSAGTCDYGAAQP